MSNTGSRPSQTDANQQIPQRMRSPKPLEGTQATLGLRFRSPGQPCHPPWAQAGVQCNSGSATIAELHRG